MTTKTLTGTYNAGYLVSPSITVLKTTASAYTGGVGIVASAPLTVVNLGRVIAGAGAAGGAGSYTGAAGNTGIDLGAVGTVIDFNTVVGGHGGAGGYNGVNGYAGGAGGGAVILALGGAVTNHGPITGGDGGGGASSLFGHAGSGGAGGDGIQLGSAGSVVNGGFITGGNGGAGGYGYLLNAPLGGVGGAGVAFAASGTLTNNGGTIQGGVGGAAGDTYLDGGFAGRGGAGFSALATSTLINNGLIHGGRGGTGTPISPGHAYDGPPGQGGAGVMMNGGTILNGGTIVGGYAGMYGNVYPQYRGAEGIAAYSAPITLINNGLIQGGGSIAYLNYPSGEIVGPALLADGGSVLNRGTMEGGLGILLSGAGTITNGGATHASALIEGWIGIYIGINATGSTVINFGTVEGADYSGAYAVKFEGPGDVLIAETGAKFVGAIAGGDGTLEIIGGANTISGLGAAGVLFGADSADFGGFATYVMQGDVALAATNTLRAGQTLTDGSALAVTGSIAERAGATVVVDAGAAMTFTGAGSILAGTVGGAGSVAFDGGADTLNGTDLTATDVTVKGASLTLKGAITNSGTAAVIGAKTPTRLLIGAGGATLVGGAWALSGGAGQSAVVMGLTAADTLTNASATISGAGMLGGGQMTLVNKSAGTIDGDESKALIIDTGPNQIATSGLIEASGAGGVTIQSAVLNGGRLEADGGTLTANGVVRGAGSGVIASGALVFNSTFTENVTFSGTSGILKLAKSQSYTGAVTGFSHIGGTSLDLGDIAFVGAGEATFSGTATSGVLTVTDGSHTAHITLIGDYTGSTFTASSDGHGGVSIVDPNNSQGVPPIPPHRFIAAMAAFGTSAGMAVQAIDAAAFHEPMVFKPRAMIA